MRKTIKYICIFINPEINYCIYNNCCIMQQSVRALSPGKGGITVEIA